jgi:HAD superfamily hydrolase (TIGR01509 family)
MSKLIAFDLDGVLLDAKQIHYESLNKSLKKFLQYEISWEEHLKIYDGLKTKDKLKILESKGFAIDNQIDKNIFIEKQRLTLIALSNLKNNNKLISIVKTLKEKNFYIACCSNSIKRTVEIALKNLGLYGYFDLIISNEDVNFSKPHPEMYWKAMSYFGVYPNHTLIVEDSPIGLMAAYSSGSKVLRVNNSDDFTLDSILDAYNNKEISKAKWVDKKMNVVIPMAGNGSRFAQAGYTFPKPLIEVNGKAMIEVVVENLNVDANFIFIIQKQHIEKYNVDSMLKFLYPGCKIVEVESLTEGAACTVLLAKDYIDNKESLLIANSDQFIEWNSLEFLYKMNEQNLDAGIVSFEASHPKWSYARIDENNFVVEVAEKNPISDIATVGIYYWKHGSDFVKYAEKMIDKNIRVNNEFYVCPVFNEAILDNKKIKTFNISNMWGLGTPEDLDYFLKNYKKKEN